MLENKNFETAGAIRSVREERLRYKYLSELVFDKSTPLEVILLIWEELWAYRVNDISVNNAKALSTVIIDLEVVKPIVLTSHIVEHILNLSEASNKDTIRKFNQADMLSYLLKKIQKDSSADTDISEASKLLVLFNHLDTEYYAFKIASSISFPFDLVYNLAVAGNRTAKSVKKIRYPEFRQKALELILEQTSEDLHSAPDNMLWDIVKWDWMSTSR
jgi:hypothetical protein